MKKLMLILCLLAGINQVDACTPTDTEITQSQGRVVTGVSFDSYGYKHYYKLMIRGEYVVAIKYPDSNIWYETQSQIYQTHYLENVNYEYYIITRYAKIYFDV